MEPREFLRTQRKAKGWTQEDLAKFLGEKGYWVSRRETGETPLSLSDLARLRKLFAWSEEQWLEATGWVAA